VDLEVQALMKRVLNYMEKILRVCEQCHKEFYFAKYRLKYKGRGLFCSRSCVWKSHIGKQGYTFKDLTDKQIGRLLVIKRSSKKLTNGSYYWHCKCACGKAVIVPAPSLVKATSKSCGCWQKENMSLVKSIHRNAVHGKESREYKTWQGMKDRCSRPKASNYKYYGARGIKVCDRWLKFENFLADMGKRPLGTTLDRVDTNGDYKLSNCRWATATQQINNRRPFKRRSSGKP